MPPTLPRSLRATLPVLALATMSLLGAPRHAAAQPPGPLVVVTLSTGETLRGTLVQQTDQEVILDHPTLGRLTLPASSVAGLAAVADDAAPQPVEAPTTPPQPAPLGAVPDPASEVVVPAEKAFFEGWTGTFEFGLFGSEGNTRRLNLRTGIAGKRETDDTSTTFDLRYIYATDRSNRTDNKARLDLRNDWLPDEGSRWRPFVLSTGEYDEFQEWDFRVAAFAGMGYEFMRSDATLLIGRVGLGASRDFGGSDNSIRPEGLIGADLEHRINDRQRLTATVDFFPDLGDIGDFRATARAGWEILLDAESKITLRLGVESRYDSTPGDARRNDLDYFAVIVIPF